MREISEQIEEVSKNVTGIGERLDKADESSEAMQKQIEELGLAKDNMAEMIKSFEGALKSTHQQIYRGGDYVGQFKSADDARAFGHVVLHCVLHQEKSGDWLDKQGMDVKAMLAGTSTQGAEWVPSVLSNTILDLVQGRYGMFRQNCRVWPGTPDTIPTLEGDPTVYVPGEGAQITASDLTSGSQAMTYKMWTALVLASLEIEDDAMVALGEMVARSIARAFGKQEDACGFMGDGTSTYFSITGVMESIGAAGVQETVSATLANLVYAELLALIGLLPDDYDTESTKFYCHRTVWSFLLGVKDANGNQAIDNLTKNEQPKKSLLGYPLVTAPCFPKLSDITAGTQFLWFGDLWACGLLAEKRKLELAESKDIKFDYNLNAIRAIQRKAIQAVNCGDGSNPGAMVALKLKSST